jgi:uncharacterized membrane protein
MSRVPPSPPPSTVESNIHCVADLERSFENRRNFVDRVADLIGGFSGSFGFVALHIVWFSLWFLINTGVVPIFHRFDPYPFILLAMIVSVEGVLLSTFVLMKQNRMQQRSDSRDHLNLQIDLLAEKEVTKALQLLRAICRRLEIPEAELDAELTEMANTTSVDSLAKQIQSDLPSKS